MNALDYESKEPEPPTRVHRTPKLWRAWQPVIVQLTGLAIALAGPSILPHSFGIAAVPIGAAIWLTGFFHNIWMRGKIRR